MAHMSGMSGSGGLGGLGGFQGFGTQYGNQPQYGGGGYQAQQQIQNMPFVYGGYAQPSGYGGGGGGYGGGYGGGGGYQQPTGGGYNLTSGYPPMGPGMQGGGQGLPIGRNPVGTAGGQIPGGQTGGQYTGNPYQDIFGIDAPGSTPTPPPDTTQADDIQKIMMQQQFAGMQGGVGGQSSYVNSLMEAGMDPQQLAGMFGLNIDRYDSTGIDQLTREEALRKNIRWQEKNQAMKSGGGGRTSGGGFGGGVTGAMGGAFGTGGHPGER